MKKALLPPLLLSSIIAFSSAAAFAAHPLVTDDTGTVGKGRVQVELNGEYGREAGDGTTEYTTEVAPIITYGIVDTIDVVVGTPYQYIRTENGDGTVEEDGAGDTSLEVKWRFYEKDGLGLALKPGITLPAGDRKRGIGSGRVGYSLFLIGTQEVKPFAFHANLGYVQNENRNDERRDLWHASFASEVEVVRRLSVVANIGVEASTDREESTAPAFVLGGIIYELSENLYLDAGYKHGLNKPETDSAILAGVTFTF
ncbi:MAG: transporter [Nitrospirota bacterium]